MNFRSVIFSLLLSGGAIADDTSPPNQALIEKLSLQVEQLSRDNRELIARVEQLELRSDADTTSQRHRMAKSSKAGGPVANTCELTSYECDRLHNELSTSQSTDITHLHSQQCETFKYIMDMLNAPNSTESKQFLEALHCPTNGWPPIPQPVMKLVGYIQNSIYWNVNGAKATACGGLVNIDANPSNGLSFLSFKNGYSAQEELLPNTNAIYEECGNKCLGDNKCVASYVPIGMTTSTVICHIIHQSDTITSPHQESCGFSFEQCTGARSIYVKGQNGTDFCPLGGP